VHREPGSRSSGAHPRAARARGEDAMPGAASPPRTPRPARPAATVEAVGYPKAFYRPNVRLHIEHLFDMMDP